MKFSASCPHCHKRLSVDSRLSDETVKCPGCHSVFTCPSPPAREVRVASRPAPAHMTARPATVRAATPLPPPAPSSESGNVPGDRKDGADRVVELLKSVPLVGWMGSAVAVVLTVILVILVSAPGGGDAGDGDTRDGQRNRVVRPYQKAPAKFTKAPDATDTPPPSIADVTKSIDPSVVTIVVYVSSQGSGFIVGTDGTIVTNYHVIEGAKEAKVIFRDGTKVDVLGFSAFSAGKDLAVIHVDSTGRTLLPLGLADELPSKGSTVLAFGSPKGLSGSVSDGIVSAIRPGSEVSQLLTTDIYVGLLKYDLDAVWIQTTAPISGGNSGGPLVNRGGQVVGVNSWIRTGGQNLNFAISATHVKQLLAQRKSRVRPLSQLPKPRKSELAKEAEVASVRILELTKIDITKHKNVRAERLSVFGVSLGMTREAALRILFRDQRLMVMGYDEGPSRGRLSVYDRKSDGTRNNSLFSISWPDGETALPGMTLWTGFSKYTIGDTRQLFTLAVLDRQSNIVKSFLGYPNKIIPVEIIRGELRVVEYHYGNKGFVVLDQQLNGERTIALKLERSRP